MGQGCPPPARRLQLGHRASGSLLVRAWGQAPAAPRRGWGNAGAGDSRSEAPSAEGDTETKRRRACWKPTVTQEVCPGQPRVGPWAPAAAAWPCSSMSTPSSPRPPGPPAGASLLMPHFLGQTPGMSGPVGAAPTHHPFPEHSVAPATVSQNPSPGVEQQHTAVWGFRPSTPQISNGAPCMGPLEPPGRPVCTPKSAGPRGAPGGQPPLWPGPSLLVQSRDTSRLGAPARPDPGSPNT